MASTYRLHLRHGRTFDLDSENNDLHAIADRLTITPANAASAPHWVFNSQDDVAVRVDDIVAIEKLSL